MTPAQNGGYYSSAEKDAVREKFDLPLLEAFKQAKRSKLHYFGLPGNGLLDVKAWRHLLASISAVENSLHNLEIIETALDTEYSDLRSYVHFGDVDLIIIKNRGNLRRVAGEPHHPTVSTEWDRVHKIPFWDFDIVNLDYFGPFLPIEASPTGRKKDRATALRKLFDIERQDARKPWVLLITVEATRLDNQDKEKLKQYLRSIHSDAETSAVINFLTTDTGNSVQDVTRLLHGVFAALFSYAASNANLGIYPRGTILYHGANERPMIHLAYQFQPTQEPIGAPVPILQLLRAPILRTKNPVAHPWFEPLSIQAPGITNESTRTCLNFLASTCLEDILGTSGGHN